MAGRCYPKYQPCGDPTYVPKVGSDDAFSQTPTRNPANLAVNLIDLRLIPWLLSEEDKPDAPNPPSYVKEPPAPVVYYNLAQVVTACCVDTEILNSVSVLVAPGTFSSLVSQADANQQAVNYWQPLVEVELNCVDVTTSVVTGTALGVLAPFEEEQAGGTWLSDPWIGDAFFENTFFCV